jgi:hypothetical protein
MRAYWRRTAGEWAGRRGCGHKIHKTLEGEYNQSNVPVNPHKRNIPLQLAEKGGQKGQF